MSSSQSNLSSTGFDFVVAVTQDSINATLEEYLYGGLQEVILCYVYDSSNNPVPTDYTTFVATNPDPFSVPAGTPSTDPRVQSLNTANFAFAIKAKLGLPPGVTPQNIPPIVALNAGQSNISYTLMFSEFVATELIFGPRGSITWFNQAQPSGTAWTFTGPVNLDFQDAAFANLPAAVQNQLKGLESQGATFNVQQLYYDLNSSDLEQGFQFNNLPSNSNLNTFMTADFVDTYWKALGGATVLGYGANQTSAPSSATLAVTDLNFFTPDAVGNEGAPLTLNYLCATNNDTLPDTTHAGFGWNWIEPNEASQFDGVAALNRNTLAQYFDQQLRGYVATNCYSPMGQVRCWLCGTLDTEVCYQADLVPLQPPTVTFPASGATVLTYDYQSPVASDTAGLDTAKLDMSSSFNLQVSFQGNTIVIVQHLVVWTYINNFVASVAGNIVDKQITDTYTLGINDSGQIVATLQSVPVDNPQTPQENAVMNILGGGINGIAAKVAAWIQGCVATNVTDVPASVVQSFVFPGGDTFSFSDVSFSANQDLVSHITYADPT